MTLGSEAAWTRSAARLADDDLGFWQGDDSVRPSPPSFPSGPLGGASIRSSGFTSARLSMSVCLLARVFFQKRASSKRLSLSFTR
eukprot:scaffold444_cov282-Pinguiococcus_pyrenoidosus.AAC.1